MYQELLGISSGSLVYSGRGGIASCVENTDMIGQPTLSAGATTLLVDCVESEVVFLDRRSAEQGAHCTGTVVKSTDPLNDS